MPYLLRALASSCVVIALAACGGKRAAPATTPVSEPAPAIDASGACPDGYVLNTCPGDPTCPECAVCGPPVCVPAP
ncbi:MAG: hypothetical protein IPH44_28345 [Myxococcales bacterium]|nr:hypothetical protein [Myxococcales bacterium]MBK7191482.1 hypothetical protein [Myxococcales bacterium]